MRTRNFWISITFAGLAMPASAQWLGYHAPGTPRTSDGKPNLSAPAPLASNGKPDLSGIWQSEGAPIAELRRLLPSGANGLGEDIPSRYFFNVLADFKPEEAPITPAAAALFAKRAENFGKESPITHCLPQGVPGGELLPEPYKIVQTPGVTLILYEENTNFRQVYSDGRKLPEDPQPAWMGYSVGKWEGETFVVDTIGFNDRGWLDFLGHPHSEALHVTERFHRRDFGHLEIEITIDDPKNYTKAFTFKVNQVLHADSDLLENFCAENEKDASHMVGK